MYYGLKFLMMLYYGKKLFSHHPALPRLIAAYNRSLCRKKLSEDDFIIVR